MQGAEQRHLISFTSLKQAMDQVVGDIASFYCPIHAIQPARLLTVLPDLLYLQGLVYEADFQLECDQRTGTKPELDLPEAQVRNFLALRGLHVPEILGEMANALTYARLETRIMDGSGLSPLNLERAVRLRSSDIRLVHRVMLALLGIPADPRVFALLAPIECAGEIDDDIRSFDDDQSFGRFNTLVVLRRLYGERAVVELGTLLDSFRRETYQHLNALKWRKKIRLGRLLVKYQLARPSPALPAGFGPQAPKAKE